MKTREEALVLIFTSSVITSNLALSYAFRYSLELSGLLNERIISTCLWSTVKTVNLYKEL